MKPADDFHDLGHGLFEWSAYDPASKVDLHAHAHATAGGQLVFVDPIPLRPAALAELLAAAGDATPAAVLVTNGNHARAADAFRRRLGLPVLAPAEAVEALRADGLENVEAIAFAAGANRPLLNGALTAIPLPGFAPGEMAIFCPDRGGVLLIGDALINLPEPYAFTPLPAKYCTEPKRTADSLRRLLDLPFPRMVFAHGTPILSGARERLEALLKH